MSDKIVIQLADLLAELAECEVNESVHLFKINGDIWHAQAFINYNGEILGGPCSIETSLRLYAENGEVKAGNNPTLVHLPFDWEIAGMDGRTMDSSAIEDAIAAMDKFTPDGRSLETKLSERIHK